MEVFRNDPLTSIPHTGLLQHQSQTPTSFYSGRPVLHRLCTNTRLVALRHELLSSPALSHLIDVPVANGATTNGATTNGHIEEHGEEEVISNIDVFVFSQ